MKHATPTHLSDYRIDRATGRVVLIRPNVTTNVARVTMADFLRSDVSKRKRSYLRALEKSALDQEKLIELAAKASST